LVTRRRHQDQLMGRRLLPVNLRHVALAISPVEMS
jgi:hypothetical protein